MAQLKGNKLALKTTTCQRQLSIHENSGRTSMSATEKQSTRRCHMEPNCSLNVHCGRLSHSRDMPVVEAWHLASTGEMFVGWNGTN